MKSEEYITNGCLMVVWQGQAVFTPEEVSRLLGVDVGTVHRLIRTGQLGACSLRDSLGVPPHMLKEYQRQATHVTPAA